MNYSCGTFGDEKISRLGFGTMRLPMDENKKIDLEQVKEMVDYALENGVNYFDTAYKYHEGDSEIAVREALVKRHPRQDFFLADKMPPWLCKSAEDVHKIFDDQLSKCGVDYFDFYLVHSVDDGSWKEVQDFDIPTILSQKKGKGQIRHLGISVHCSPAILREIMEKYGKVLEFVQIQMNYMDWDYIGAKELYAIALEYEKPIIIMEPLRGGMLANPASDKAKAVLDAASATAAGDGSKLSYADFALGYVDQLEGVFLTLSGMSNLEQMQQNTAFFSGGKLSAAQLEAVSEAGKIISADILVPCTGCDYCYNCPSEIKISKIFKGYNEAAMKGFHFIWAKLSKMYKSLGPNAKDCVECGACETSCPQQIKIIDMLKVIDEKYEELEKAGE